MWLRGTRSEGPAPSSDEGRREWPTANMRTRRSGNHDRLALNSCGDGNARRKGVRRGNRLPRTRIEVEKLYNDGCGPTAAKYRPRFSAHFGTGRVLRMACRKVVAGCTLRARAWQSRRSAGTHLAGPLLAGRPRWDRAWRRCTLRGRTWQGRAWQRCLWWGRRPASRRRLSAR